MTSATSTRNQEVEAIGLPVSDKKPSINLYPELIKTLALQPLQLLHNCYSAVPATFATGVCDNVYNDCTPY